jgi:threonine-phosphate decarboxylase
MADDFIPLHGGQLHEIAEWFRVPEESLLDFSASISPIPLGNGIVDALCESLRNRKVLARYPDPEYPDLEQAIAQYVGVLPGSICIANGGMPLLDATVRAFGLRRCLVLVPAFGEYQRVLRACGVERRTLLLRERENFLLDPDAVLREVACYSADGVLLANPHSPSSCLMPPGVLAHLQSALSTLGVTTILDEAFIDYSPELSLSGLAANVDGFVVLRSLTKFFAMAGLRVAYSVAHPENRERIKSILPLWPVDSLAASAARLALLDTALVRKTREANAGERRWLSEQMISLGLQVFPGSANYLLVKLPEGIDGFTIWRGLIVERLVVVRNCATFEGLTKQYLRIAVGDRFANQILISALAHVL